MSGFRLLWIPTLAAAILGSAALVGQEVPDPKLRRFGLDVNFTQFPQKTPQEAMASVVQAIDGRRIDYLLAHLADPDYVEAAVRDYKAALTKGKEQAKEILAFDRLVRETAEYFLEDPSILKDLRRFTKEAKVDDKKKDDKAPEEKDKDDKAKEPTVVWQMKDDRAVGTVPGLLGRQVFLKNVGGRWRLENRQQ